uniref:Uncharacterized protein n=1 Tax=Arundo donax TaxID=35708 RepID=A0A0A8Y1N4_ARUDO
MLTSKILKWHPEAWLCSQSLIQKKVVVARSLDPF